MSIRFIHAVGRYSFLVIPSSSARASYITSFISQFPPERPAASRHAPLRSPMGLCTSKASATSLSRDSHATSAEYKHHSGLDEGLEGISSDPHPSSVGRHCNPTVPSQDDSDKMKENGNRVGAIPPLPLDGGQLRGTTIETEKTDLQKQPSKLLESQRRRLSVSTVKTHEDVPESTTNKSVDDIGDDKGVNSLDKWDYKVKPEKLVSRVENYVPQDRKRAKIKKFPDPALELLNGKVGTIQDVTVDMIKDLVSESESSYMVFGSLSSETQRGFDVRNMFSIV